MRRLLLVTHLFRLAGLMALVILALTIVWQAHRPDPGAGQERSDRLAGALDVGHTLEQTFTAGQENLCAVEVFPRIPPGRLNPRYTLTLYLSQKGAARDLASTRLSLVDARARQHISLAFPAQPDSRGKAYLLRIVTDAPADTISLLSSAEDAYPTGELRQDGQPTGRDLTFRTYTALISLDLLRELTGAAPEYGLLLLFTLLFGAVGGSFLTLFRAWPSGEIAERGLWAVGVGLALVPLVFLLVGLFARWVFVALFLLALVRLGVNWKRTASRIFRSVGQHQAISTGWTLLLLFLWALVIRLLQIRDITAPMWVDGLEHVQMVQAILDAGRMPDGLLYHIGFHTQVALLHDLTGLPLPRLIVLFGQMISALAGPALYVIGKRIFSAAEPESIPRAETAALLGALALAVFPILPAYLINWGRYPFLLGLTLLPFTLSATIDALREPPARDRLVRYALLAVLLGGQFLSHYGTLSFWVSFCGLFLFVERPAWIKKVKLRQVIVGGLMLIGIGLAMAYLRFGDNLWGKLASTIAESRQVSEDLNYASIWQINLRAGGFWLVLTGGCGVLWAAAKARKPLLLAGGWFLAQAVLILLQSPILGFALASYANLLLALPLPLAILTGGLLGALLPLRMTAADQDYPAGSPPGSSAWRIGRGLVITLLVLAGGITQIGVLNPTTLLYGPADAQAMAWIRANLPAGTRILINSRFWSNIQIVPADGGGWVPTMTGRTAVQVQEKGQLTNLAAFIEQEKIEYIYLGRFSGFLRLTILEQNPERYQRLYHQSGIDIYSATRQNIRQPSSSP